jgi:hypothetical protein
MAHKTFYVARDQRHPLYKTRMLTAGQELNLTASAARLFSQLGVDMSDEAPRKAAAPKAETVEEPEVAKAAPKKAAPRRRKAAPKK